tara:strand:- start:1495 stop:1668 length:174 start_codon:yes stop_codon:yes gene_type:complete
MSKHREVSEMLKDKNLQAEDIANYAVMSYRVPDHQKTVNIENLINWVLDLEKEKINK